MGYGFPASIGVQVAHPDALVINVAGEASLADEHAGDGDGGAVPRCRSSSSSSTTSASAWSGSGRSSCTASATPRRWSEALPDFVKLAEAFGAKGIRCDDPAKLDDAILEMLDHPGPVIFDCVVEKHENCFPMIPSGKAHNEMILGEDAAPGAIDAGGAVLV